MNDTSASLTMVVAETDRDGKETSYYTRSDELISMEKGNEVWYYLYDGHGSVRTLTNEAGRITDAYAYDAMIFAIGLSVIAQLRAIVAVETAAYISSEIMLSIGLEGALSGSSNTTAISNELLFKAVNAVTLAYMIAGDCVALDVVSSTVEETRTWVETSSVALEEENKKQ